MKIAFISSYVVLAQTNDISTKFNDAESYIQNENYAEALPIYVELASLDTSNANFSYKAGLCYLKIGNKVKCLKNKIKTFNKLKKLLILFISL